MNIRQSHLSQHLWTYVFLFVLGAFVVLPLLITLSQSLMTTQQVNRWPPPILPQSPTLEAYDHMFTRPDLKLPLWLGNSIYAATAYTIAVL
ncbi:MAG: hypothetical protein ABI970_15760, partial [Chloroflexota bacterium]